MENVDTLHRASPLTTTIISLPQRDCCAEKRGTAKEQHAIHLLLVIYCDYFTSMAGECFGKKHRHSPVIKNQSI